MNASTLTPEVEAIRPQPVQERFLSSTADVVIFGGAAGGGKTYALLFEPLYHVANPQFRAVLFRRTCPEITNPGGMWDDSCRIYPSQRAIPKRGNLEWLFPSGARIEFHHLQRDETVHDWQGAQVPLICFDQLEHFTEHQFFYLLSRNRSTCGVKPYVRATCNPDADSWLAGFVSWWIDQATGYPIPERDGVMRWFARVDEKIVWEDTAAELKAKYPDTMPKSCTFIPALLEDNPALMTADPGYMAWLMAQPLVERERLLRGNWKIRAAAGKVFNRGWFEVVKAVPAGGDECRFWDLASREPKLKATKTEDDPDWTAGVKLRRVDGVYYVTDCAAFREPPAVALRLLINICRQDALLAEQTGTRYSVGWEVEPGSASKWNNVTLYKLLDGLTCKGTDPLGDKVERALPLSAQAEAGNVKVLAGEWNEAFLAELHSFPDGAHDDRVDGASGSYARLTQARRLAIG